MRLQWPLSKCSWLPTVCYHPGFSSPVLKANNDRKTIVTQKRDNFFFILIRSDLNCLHQLFSEDNRWTSEELHATLLTLLLWNYQENQKWSSSCDNNKSAVTDHHVSGVTTLYIFLRRCLSRWFTSLAKASFYVFKKKSYQQLQIMDKYD